MEAHATRGGSVTLDATATALLQVGIDAIPPIFRDDARVMDDLRSLAAMVGKAQTVGSDMLARVLVEQASVDTGWTDPVTHASINGPDWLDMDAGDYGTSRQYGETDATLRTRMRTTPAGVIRSEILALAQAIVDASGVVGDAVAMVEMPRDEAHVGVWGGDDAGTGGVFSTVAGKMCFTPTTPFAYPPCVVGISGGIAQVSITLSGCADSGNDGTFVVEDISGNGAVYTNGSGVAGADTGAGWSTARGEVGGGFMDGYAMAFADRGYRAWFAPGGLAPDGRSHPSLSGVILILPYGTTDSTRRSVVEMIRQRVAAGVVKIVETRTTP
jgi:hypothetical protein